MKTFELHESECDELLALLKRTIDHGENSSALVIGPRGTGKTYLVNRALNSLKAYLKTKKCENDLVIVKLSGCVHTDDRSALVEISRQLELDNVIDDKVLGSFSDNFDFLLRSFRTGGKESKPLMFILDEFDLFTKHKGQLLLYTLLNTIQMSTSPMCLIGLTCRLDVLDQLEKRVKSRFSHRQIYLFNNYTFEEYMELAKRIIIDFDLLKVNKDLNTFLDLFFNDDTVIKQLVKQFDYDKSILALKRLFMLPVSCITDQIVRSKNISSFKEEFIKSFRLNNFDTKLEILNDISVLELTLLVIVKQITELYTDEPFNFELVFSEYNKFCSRKNIGQKYEKQVLLKAFEHLIALKFLMPYTETQMKSRVNKENALMHLALDIEEINDCLNRYPNCPTELKYSSS